MSQTPTDAGDPADHYRLGWQAINRLVNMGFSWSGHERNCAFLNTRGGAFADISSVVGLAFEDDGRSVASVDWDLDGDLDLFVTNRTGPRLRFLRNGLDSEGDFLQLKLEGRSCNRDAIGARVEVLLDDPLAPPLLRTRRAGDGYQAQSSGWMHFGLGSSEVSGVRVSWPDGSKEVFPDVGAGERVLLVQGSGQGLASKPPSLPCVLTHEAPLAKHSTSSCSVVLATPIPMPQIEVESSDGHSGSLFGVLARARDQGRAHKPLLVQLWASWCAPCAGELAEFTSAAEALRQAGLEILALNIEPEAAREGAVEMLEHFGWPHPSGFAPAHTVEILDALQGSILRHGKRIPLPSSFLIDGNSNLVAFYLGSVDPEEVLQDLRLLELDAAQRLAAALPFPGRWFRGPPQEDPTYMERAFLARGLPDTAREYQPGWMHLQYGRALAARKQLQRAEEHFRSALEIGPYLAEAFAGLGQTLHLQGRTAEAVDAYRSALGLDPDNEAILFSLGLAQAESDDHTAAQAQVERLRALGSPFGTELESRIRALKGN